MRRIEQNDKEQQARAEDDLELAHSRDGPVGLLQADGAQLHAVLHLLNVVVDAVEGRALVHHQRVHLLEEGNGVQSAEEDVELLTAPLNVQLVVAQTAAGDVVREDGRVLLLQVLRLRLP
ncbi:hypothetical protein TYRP_013685 [Tyrophagus putrescentiae]|nr:hypothetical protein TYRP_013685 [Tyrophagus putrescentiae]